MCVCMCVCVFMSVCMYVCMFLWVYVYVCVCVCVHMCMWFLFVFDIYINPNISSFSLGKDQEITVLHDDYERQENVGEIIVIRDDYESQQEVPTVQETELDIFVIRDDYERPQEVPNPNNSLQLSPISTQDNIPSPSYSIPSPSYSIPSPTYSIASPIYSSQPSSSNIPLCYSPSSSPVVFPLEVFENLQNSHESIFECENSKFHYFFDE